MTLNTGSKMLKVIILLKQKYQLLLKKVVIHSFIHYSLFSVPAEWIRESLKASKCPRCLSETLLISVNEIKK